MTGLSGIRGFKNQRMGGRAKRTAVAFVIPTGQHTWVCPERGVWDVAQWGAGGAGATNSSGGDSGGFARTRRRLSSGQVISLNVGSAIPAAAGQNTVVTFPDGTVVTTQGGDDAGGGGGSGSSSVGGVPNGADVRLAGRTGGAASTDGPAGQGSAGGPGGLTAGGGTSGGGAGASGIEGFQGGAGGKFTSADGTNTARGSTPGGGSRGDGGPAGDGMAIIVRVSS